jgi:hypothetical protein
VGSTLSDSVTALSAGAERDLDELGVQDAPAPQREVPVLKNGMRYSHAAMMDMLIAEPWLRQNDIARRFARSASWISTIMASDAWQAAWAARKEEILDPILKLTIEENTRGLYNRSLDILKEKLDKPADFVSDQLAVQVLAQTARALGYGARPEQRVEVNVTTQIENHAGNLVTLLRRTKATVAEEVIEGETLTHEGTPSSNGGA